MGFTGRPSAGCGVCKQRKKRCDLNKPFCKQCQKIARECPGVPDYVDVFFRNTFSEFDGNERQWIGIDPGLSHPGSSQSLFLTKPSYRLVLDCDSLLFYVVLATGSYQRLTKSWLELQAKLYHDTKVSSALTYAVKALAAMTMSSDLRIPQLAELARQVYGRALRVANTALADPKSACRNDTVVAISAMICFELKNIDLSLRSRYQAHAKGMRQLLKIKAHEQDCSMESVEVLRTLRSQIVHNFLISEDSCQIEENLGWQQFTTSNEDNAIDELCDLAAKLANLRFIAKQVTKSSSQSVPIGLVREAARLKDDLDHWQVRWQDELNYQIIFRPNESQFVWQQVVYNFTDASNALLSNNYQFLYMHLLDMIVQIPEIMTESGFGAKPDETTTFYSIREIVDKLCYTIYPV